MKIRTECSQVSHTLHIVQLWVSVLIPYVTGYRKAELVPHLKLQCCGPAFMVPACIPHTAGGERGITGLTQLQTLQPTTATRLRNKLIQ